MFRHGYRSDFPRHELGTEEIEQARSKDQHQKDARQDTTNDSSRIQQSNLSIGQRILVKNEGRRSKFDTMFEPFEYVIESLERNGVTAVNSEGMRRRRHVNDIKPIPDECHIRVPGKTSNYWVAHNYKTLQPTGNQVERPPQQPHILPQQQESPQATPPMSQRPTRERRAPPKLADYKR